MSMPKNCQITKTKELGIVPRMHALFLRWIAIEIAWCNKYYLVKAHTGLGKNS